MNQLNNNSALDDNVSRLNLNVSILSFFDQFQKNSQGGTAPKNQTVIFLIKRESLFSMKTCDLKLSLVKSVDLLYSPLTYSVDQNERLFSTHSLFNKPSSKQSKDLAMTYYSRSSAGTGIESSSVESQTGQRNATEHSDYQQSVSTKSLLLQESAISRKKKALEVKKLSQMISPMNPYELESTKEKLQYNMNINFLQMQSKASSFRESKMETPKKSEKILCNSQRQNQNESSREAKSSQKSYFIEKEDLIRTLQEAESLEARKRQSLKRRQTVKKLSKKYNNYDCFEVQDDYGLHIEQLHPHSAPQSLLKTNYQFEQQAKNRALNVDQYRRQYCENDNIHSKEQEDGNRITQQPREESLKQKNEYVNLPNNLHRLGMGEWKQTKEQMGGQALWEEKIAKLKATIKKKMPAFSTQLLKQLEDNNIAPANHSAKRSLNNSSYLNFSLNKRSFSKDNEKTSQIYKKEWNKTEQTDYLLMQQQMAGREADRESMEKSIRAHKTFQKEKTVVPSELVKKAKFLSVNPFFQFQGITREKNTQRFFIEAPTYSTQENAQDEVDSVHNLKQIKQRAITYKTFRNNVHSLMAIQLPD